MRTLLASMAATVVIGGSSAALAAFTGPDPYSVVITETDAASEGSTSTTLDSANCLLDRVVVDPDSRLTSLVPGCPTRVEFQVFGPGGIFDAFLEDDAGGVGSYEILSVGDGDLLSFEYTPPNVLPESITLTVYLDPHSPDFVCTGSGQGAYAEKTIVTSEPAADCVVSFGVSTEVDLGAMQFAVSYSASAGELPGCATGAVCTSVVADAVRVWDDDAGARLSIDLESSSGFSTPAEILRCKFKKGAEGKEPAPSDFLIDVATAGTPAPLRKPLDSLPLVVARIDCSATSTTTTTLPFEPAACGRPCSASEPEPNVRDALEILRAAVGNTACKTCICDVNRSGVVDASDALGVLSRAVGLDATVRCVTCSRPVEPTCP